MSLYYRDYGATSGICTLLYSLRNCHIAVYVYAALVDLSGIEPESIQCHCIVLPLNYKPRKWRKSVFSNFYFIFIYMKLLIPLNELNNYASREKSIPIECEHCNQVFYTCKREVQVAMKDKNRNRLKFCSRQCGGAAIDTKVKVPCDECGKNIWKRPCDIKREKHSFCSRSCSAIYGNKNKNFGLSKRSKLEIWIEKQLFKNYPNIEVLYNKRNVLNNGLELDIYIPKFKLAFELNGIFHYEPVFGSEILEGIQKRDSGKFQQCIEKNISLCVIDTTSMKYFKEDRAMIFFTIIKNILDNKLAEEVGFEPTEALRPQ